MRACAQQQLASHARTSDLRGLLLLGCCSLLSLRGPRTRLGGRWGVRRHLVPRLRSIVALGGPAAALRLPWGSILQLPCRAARPLSRRLRLRNLCRRRGRHRLRRLRRRHQRGVHGPLPGAHGRLHPPVPQGCCRRGGAHLLQQEGQAQAQRGRQAGLPVLDGGLHGHGCVGRGRGGGGGVVRAGAGCWGGKARGAAGLPPGPGSQCRMAACVCGKTDAGCAAARTTGTQGAWGCRGQERAAQPPPLLACRMQRPIHAPAAWSNSWTALATRLASTPRMVPRWPAGWARACTAGWWGAGGRGHGWGSGGMDGRHARRPRRSAGWARACTDPGGVRGGPEGARAELAAGREARQLTGRWCGHAVMAAARAPPLTGHMRAHLAAADDEGVAGGLAHGGQRRARSGGQAAVGPVAEVTHPALVLQQGAGGGGGT